MQKLHDAANAFKKADDEWHQALVAKYGNKASQMRYLVFGQGLECDVIRKAYEKRYKAMRVYEAMKQD